MFSFKPEETEPKKPAKSRIVKQTLVETIGGRNLFLEDGDMLVLEDYPFRASPLGKALRPWSLSARFAFYCIAIARHLGSHVATMIEIPSAVLALALHTFSNQDDRVLMEIRNNDVYSGSMRLGRPKNVRYTRGRSLLGHTLFVWDDDGNWPPKRRLYSSYSRANVERLAGVIDRFLGRAPAPEPEQIEWPPAPRREAIPLASKEDVAL